LDTFYFYSELSQVLDDKAARKFAELFGTLFGELSNAVTKADFQALTDQNRRTDEKLGELADAQKITEKRLDGLTVKVGELADAQKTTEKRLDGLTVKFGELADSQRRMEDALTRLTDHQIKTDKRLDRTNRQLGNLSMSFGYVLENEAYRYLPALLEQDYGIIVRGGLTRDYIADRDGNELEVNVLGKAEKEDKTYLVIGESKAQLSKRDVDRFLRKRLDRIVPPAGSELFPLLICHMITSKDVAPYARDKGIALYYSYQFR
jgi:hypothetical protein